MDNIFPLFNKSAGDGTSFIMMLTFFAGTVLLSVHNFFARDPHYYWDSIDTFVSIVGYLFIGAAITTALFGATMVLTIGKVLGLGIGVVLSIWTIWSSMKRFAKNLKISLPTWMIRRDDPSSSSRTDKYR